MHEPDADAERAQPEQVRKPVGALVQPPAPVLRPTVADTELLVFAEPEEDVIDASDPDRVRAQHQSFYERYQRPVFP